MQEEEKYLEEDITGFPTSDEKDSADLKQCTEVLTKEALLAQLKSSEGWKVLDEFLKNVTASFIEQLKVEEDMKKIPRIQSLIVTLEFLPGVIDQVFFEASRARTYLQRYINEDQAQTG